MSQFRLTLAVILFGIVMPLAVAAYAYADTSNKQTNAFGAIVYQDNPYNYMYGKAIGGEVIQDQVPQWHGNFFQATSIRFQPSRTYTLFTETILFCGDVSGEFEGASLVIVTYERESHRLVKGSPCRELIAVDRLK